MQHVARKEAAATVGRESSFDDLNLTAFRSGDDTDDGGPPSDEATTSSINYKPSLCVATSEQGVGHTQDWEPEEQRCSSDESVNEMWQQCQTNESSDSAAGIVQQRYDIDGYDIDGYDIDGYYMPERLKHEAEKLVREAQDVEQSSDWHCLVPVQLQRLPKAPLPPSLPPSPPTSPKVPRESSVPGLVQPWVVQSSV